LERFIVDVALLVATAKLSEAVLGRVGVPSVVSYILAGFLLGPSMLGLISYGEELRVMSGIALFFLALYAGLEVSYGEFLRSSLRSTSLSLISFLLTFASAMVLCYLLGLGFNESTVVSLVLSVTALPVAAAILSELGVLNTRVGALVMGAAVATDVLVVFLLGLLVGIAVTGSPTLNSLTKTLAGVTLLILAVVATHMIISRFATLGHEWFSRISQLFRLQEAGLAMLMLSALALGALSEILGLHFIVGVFLVGLLVDESWLGERLYRRALEPIKGVTLSLLLPLFASTIGVIASMEGLAGVLNADTLKLVIAFTLVAVVVRFTAGYIGARAVGLSHVESRLVGIALTFKGAMDKVVLLAAYQTGLITPQLLLTLMTSLIIATTIAPTMLKATVDITVKERIATAMKIVN
jgi:Kef-type K+ transport system membrane component KefB